MERKPYKKRDWRKLIIAAHKYPQFANEWNDKSIQRAIDDGYIYVEKECADGHCVDVVHVTIAGKQYALSVEWNKHK